MSPYYARLNKSDGTVVAWGNNSSGQATSPAGLSGVVSIAGGQAHSLALKDDGAVVAWGNSDWAQVIVPGKLSTEVTIATGGGQSPQGSHSLVLASSGTVFAWGVGTTNINSFPNPNFGQSIVPVGLNGVAKVAAGAYHSLALKTNGTITAWGAGLTNTGVQPNFGQSAVPWKRRLNSAAGHGCDGAVQKCGSFINLKHVSQYGRLDRDLQKSVGGGRLSAGGSS